MEDSSRYQIIFNATYYISDYVACQQKQIKIKRLDFNPAFLLVDRL